MPPGSAIPAEAAERLDLLPEEIGDKLNDDSACLAKILDIVHYEGTHYDYQDEEERAGNQTPRLTKIEDALLCIERARRLADICQTAVRGRDVENSDDIALTMGNELFEALDDAREALEGKAS